MIHLFDSLPEPLEKTRRDGYIIRLKEIADLQPAEGASAAVVGGESSNPEPAQAAKPEVAPSEALIDDREVAAPRSLSRTPLNPVEEAPAEAEKVEPAEAAEATPTIAFEPRHDDFGGEFDQLAGQMTKDLTGALAGAFRSLHQLAVRDARQRQSTGGELLEEIRRLSGELGALREQMAGLEKRVQQMDTSLSGQQERVDRQSLASNTRTAQLGTRLEALDRTLQAQAAAAPELNSVCAQFQERNLSIEKRLDSQAGVIRQLHAASQDRDDRLDKLRNTLESLEHLVARPASSSLPENL